MVLDMDTAEPASGSVEDEAAVTYPGARHPDRSYHVDAHGVAIAVHEWGAEDDPPLFCVHGGFDFGQTYSVFGPRLAEVGFRVVTWDHRGHGDSAHTALYSWDGDLRDAAAVMDHITSAPAPVISHSKGGSLMLQLADAQPFRFSHLVNFDGMPSRRRTPDVAERERSRLLWGEIQQWLDHRRRTQDLVRKPGTLEELARRRQKMNPRLSLDWLRYLVSVGARRDEDGWRWKLDPSMRFGGFGPWRPEWALLRLPGLAMPFLGVLGTENEEMSWGTPPDDVRPSLPPDGRLEVVEGVGHFMHIEKPDEVLAIVCDFLGVRG
jgi:pimeloyl-ACP methyl ester carboxylesterase